MFDVASSVRYFQILDTVVGRYSEHISPEQLMILPTMVDKRPATKKVMRHLAYCYGELLASSSMGESTAFQKATYQGKSIYQMLDKGDEAHKRCRMMLDSVNTEILTNVKALWAMEVGESTSTAHGNEALENMLEGGR